jgi:starch-binding outer membrane protein, SusD/RagB family
MKKIITIFLMGIVILSCNSLDLNPLSEGSSETWYSNSTELDMAVAELFDINYWHIYVWRNFAQWDDDYVTRQALGPTSGSGMSGQTGAVVNTWNTAYKAIAAANRILNNLERAANEVTEANLRVYEANARFIRASMYARLIFFFGDVPYYTNILDIDEAFSLGRTSKETILNSVYEDYDYASQYLPLEYGNDSKFATKGAALAMKARTALYFGDWTIARDAAKACMDLGIYDLYPDFRDLFLSKTKNTVETIFSNPRSVELGYGHANLAWFIMTRNAGGYGNGYPTWELFCSYLCTDGLPIDESPLFNPREPFENRDPRLGETIVPFGSKFMGWIFNSHPDSATTFNFHTGSYVPNKECRTVDQYASYNGLIWKKSVDEDWIDKKMDPDNFIMRYADVLLMYAESCIELGQIDQSVLDAMNKVRARAYQVDYTETSSYPSITTMDKEELRKILRIERRMEFALEGLSRYRDIIRWKLAEKVLSKPNYGILLDKATLRERIVEPGLWFFPETPPIDEDGIADFTSMYNKGLIGKLSQRVWENRIYLWPIPSSEIIINPSLEQNPGW